MYTKLNETIDAMNSDDFKERFKAEYWQLKIRTDNLERMLYNYQQGTLKFTPKCTYNCLHEQFVFMKGYLDALRRRAYIEGIELGEEAPCCSLRDFSNI